MGTEYPVVSPSGNILVNGHVQADERERNAYSLDPNFEGEFPFAQGAEERCEVAVD